MADWQPIETAPADGTAFIGVRHYATVDDERQFVVALCAWDEGRFRFPNPRIGPPTHWMPFEEPQDG